MKVVKVERHFFECIWFSKDLIELKGVESLSFYSVLVGQ